MMVILNNNNTSKPQMATLQHEVEIQASVESVYEYYTNPENIKEAWPRDVIKESEPVSTSKNEEGSEMKVKGEYMGKEEEMVMEVTDKQQNRRLVTRQTQGPFKKFQSIQEFQGNGNITHVKHTIEYELPTT
jgi:ligand-binding SRPBCC domain-containing protein